MLWIEVVVAVAVLVAIAFVASRDVAGLDDPEHDVADLGLPEGRPLRSADLDRLNLRVVGGLRGIRGYRFADVDEVLARAREALGEHEARHGTLPDAAATGEPHRR